MESPSSSSSPPPPPPPPPGTWLERLLGRVGLRSRYYSRTAPYVAFAQIFTALVSLGFMIGLTHICEAVYGTALLDPTDPESTAALDYYGKYNVVRQLFGLLVLTSIPLASHALIRTVAQGNDGTYRSMVRTRMLFALIGTAIMAGTGVFYQAQGKTDVALAIWITMFLFPVHSALDNTIPYLIGKQRVDRSSIWQSVFVLMGPLALVSFLFTDSIVAFIVTFIVLQTACRLVFHLLVTREIPADAPVDGKAMRYGFDLTLINLTVFIQERLHFLVLGVVLVDLANLALFTLGRSLARFITEGWKALSRMAMPRFAQQTEEYSRRRIITVMSLFYPFNIAAGVALILLLPYAIRLLLPESFHDMILYAQLYLMPICLFTPLELVYRLKIVAHMEKSRLLKLNLVEFFIEIGGLFVFIPLFGLVGIIYARILAKGVQAAYVVWELVRGEKTTEEG